MTSLARIAALALLLPIIAVALAGCAKTDLFSMIYVEIVSASPLVDDQGTSAPTSDCPADQAVEQQESDFILVRQESTADVELPTEAVAGIAVTSARQDAIAAVSDSEQRSGESFFLESLTHDTVDAPNRPLPDIDGETITAGDGTMPPPSPTPVPISVPMHGVPRSASVNSRGVPILMYHYIRVNPVPSDTLGYNLSVTPADFDAQMAFLAARGYHSVHLGDLGTAADAFGKPVVITFDDGYQDAFTAAMPVLDHYGFRGTFYLITTLVGNWRYLSWEQARALAFDGHGIGSHTISHPALTALGRASLAHELAGSRVELETRLGHIVSDLCYPSGYYNGETISVARETGYRTAVTTQGGIYQARSDPYQMPRVRISGGMTLAGFAAALGEPPP